MACKWCGEFPEPVLKEYGHWNLVLAESQHLLGWCHAVLKEHKEGFEELTDQELLELKQVVKDWKAMVSGSFSPDWYNEAHFSNIDRHLHVQLIPRYAGKREFDGRTFSDSEYGKMPKHEWHPEKREFLERLAADLRNRL